jgi:formyl-CoA transferase
VFARLCDAMGRPELAVEYASHETRGTRQAELDQEVARWTATMPVEELLTRLRAYDVPVGLINAAFDLAVDPHIAARDMVVRLAAGYERAVPMAGVVPKFSRTPGSIRHVGPALGADTDEVLRDLAELSDDEIVALRDAGVID